MNAPASHPTIADIEAAAGRLRGQAVPTPLLESEALNRAIGGRLLVKAEVLQVTGSFKFRGAYNAIGLLDASARARGVVAFSSGNHAQGVAAAARRHGTTAVIVMPADAPDVKREGTLAWGARIVAYDRIKDDREGIARRIAADEGRVLIAPYDDPAIVAGQGTVGLELAAQAAAAGARLDAVLVPCGGGGLIAGCAIALGAKSPGTAVWAVEPEGFDDTARSLAEGTRQGVRPGAASIADALMAPMPGSLTFAINRTLLAGGLAVPDRAMLEAMATGFRHLKIVIEPGGAVALAAVLGATFDARGKTIAVVASGGNVDPATFARALNL